MLLFYVPVGIRIKEGGLFFFFDMELWNWISKVLLLKKKKKMISKVFVLWLFLLIINFIIFS